LRCATLRSSASEPCAQALFCPHLRAQLEGAPFRGSGDRLERKARNPALILGYNKGSGRGRRASASAVREPPARLRTALIRIAQRPPGLHTERPWRRTAGLSGSVRHQNNERKRFAFRVDAGDDQPWPAALRPGLTGGLQAGETQIQTHERSSLHTCLSRCAIRSRAPSASVDHRGPWVSQHGTGCCELSAFRRLELSHPVNLEMNRLTNSAAVLGQKPNPTSRSSSACASDSTGPSQSSA